MPICSKIQKKNGANGMCHNLISEHVFCFSHKYPTLSYCAIFPN